MATEKQSKCHVLYRLPNITLGVVPICFRLLLSVHRLSSNADQVNGWNQKDYCIDEDGVRSQAQG